MIERNYSLQAPQPLLAVAVNVEGYVKLNAVNVNGMVSTAPIAKRAKKAYAQTQSMR